MNEKQSLERRAASGWVAEQSDLVVTCNLERNRTKKISNPMHTYAKEGYFYRTEDRKKTWSLYFSSLKTSFPKVILLH